MIAAVPVDSRREPLRSVHVVRPVSPQADPPLLPTADVGLARLAAEGVHTSQSTPAGADEVVGTGRGRR